jgi:hypothetical protein
MLWIWAAPATIAVCAIRHFWLQPAGRAIAARLQVRRRIVFMAVRTAAFMVLMLTALVLIMSFLNGMGASVFIPLIPLALAVNVWSRVTATTITN